MIPFFEHATTVLKFLAALLSVVWAGRKFYRWLRRKTKNHRRS